MSTTGIGAGGLQPLDPSLGGASAPLPGAPGGTPAPSIARGGAPARPQLDRLPPPSSGGAARGETYRSVFGLWDRMLNRVSDVFGGSRSLHELSDELTDAKGHAFRDGVLTPDEASDLRAKTGRILQAYVDLATKEGYPPGALRPPTEESFEVFQEWQEIEYQFLAGKDLRGGALGSLREALGAGRGGDVDRIARQIAFDLAVSPSEASATDKVRLIRAELSRVPDRALQERALDAIGAQLGAEVQALGGAAPIDRARFEALRRFESSVSVHETPLPDAVRGTGKIFPNRPLEGWEETTRAATKASLDDLQAAGKLFLDEIPPGADVKTVALKLDLNLGCDGPPSVSDPTTTGATISELLERARADGKQIRFTVGDSCGGENVPLGRTTMDIAKDTGNYHYALKAGLRFAASEGSTDAGAALAKIEAAEARGVFFGSKDDDASTPDDLRAAEAAAADYVTVVDYDAEGYVGVDPDLGPMGLAAWGAREFQMAKPWVEADYRVHVARGASTHLIAGWTGATKGLIGLHAFGSRPVDQGMDKRGMNPFDSLGLLTQVAGFGAMFQNRTGVGIADIAARIATSGDPSLREAWDAAQGRWAQLKGDTAAWLPFEREARAITRDLKALRERGVPDHQLMEMMRTRTRAALDRADAASPGFKQALWDTVHAGTRVLLRTMPTFRGLIPDELKDEQAGARIGLLTQLPYPSDLVIQTQPKIGEGGGPDAYRTVRDVGAIIAGTDETSTDATAWNLAGRSDHLWEVNYPVHGALRYGQGPMHHDEIRDVTRR